MLRKETIMPLLIAILVIPCLIWADAIDQKLDAQEIVKKIDELYRSKSSYAEVKMNITTPHWERTLRMKVWTKGMDKTFIRIMEPAKERDIATLRIENEMWNYLPKTNKVMKIPPSMMMSSWMGSDFNNDDLVNEFSLLEDYHYKLIIPEDAQQDLLYIESIPKEGLPIVWGKIIIAIRKLDYIPVLEKYYDEKGNLMRLINFKDIKKFGDRTIPSIMEVIPQHKEGHKTTLQYQEAKFDINISKDIFSLRNLRSKS